MSNEKQLIGQELLNFLVSRFSLTEAEAIEQIHSSKHFQELPDNRQALWVGNDKLSEGSESQQSCGDLQKPWDCPD